MLYLQATKKALRVLDLQSEDLHPAGDTGSALGNWLVNVVPVGGRDAFLFMSTRSLLSFPILIGKLNPEPADLPSFLEHGVTQLTQAMKTPRNQVSMLMQDLASIALCASKDNSLVGVHSGISADYFHRIVRAGGLAKANLGDIISAVNSAPRATLGWRNSFEVSIELLAASEA